jgi:predicted transcriptional regulator
LLHYEIDRAKTEFLQIRLSPDGLEQIERVAHAEHLEKSMWARRALLKAVVERCKEEYGAGGSESVTQ